MDASVYMRPNKPKYVTVHKRNSDVPLSSVENIEIITVDKTTECHVTPPVIAEEMVSYLSGNSEGRILEPSAGTGNLIQALLNVNFDLSQIVAVEKHATLVETLTRKYPKLGCYHANFLDCFSHKETFSNIIMNPPFRQTKAHVEKALSLLAPTNSCLVALVPVTFNHDDFEIIRELPNDTFPTAKVFTKLIMVER